MATFLQKVKPLHEYKDDVYKCCSSCLNCTMSYPIYLPICPAYQKYGFYSYTSKGRAGLIEAYLGGKIPMSEDLAFIMYTCALCGACRVSCQQEWSEYNLEVFEAMRVEIVEKGFAPPQIRDYLKSILKYGNPYSQPRENRGKWAEGTGIKQYDGHEYVLYIGDVGSYDPRAQRIARALGEVLLKANVSFGILGKKENSDGNEVGKVGESGLFQYLAEENINLFQELGVKKIISLSPHSYNSMRNNYPNFGGNFEVVHYCFC